LAATPTPIVLAVTVAIASRPPGATGR
jgi:hypothetical protein